MKNADKYWTETGASREFGIPATSLRHVYANRSGAKAEVVVLLDTVVNHPTRSFEEDKDLDDALAVFAKGNELPKPWKDLAVNDLGQRPRL